MRHRRIARPPARREGRQIFADHLARFADRDGDARLVRIAARVAEPPAVEVCGRPGVGVRTVTGALTAAGLRVGAPGAVAVLVIAEVLKPEDSARLAELSRGGRPVVVVFNKADLAGSGRGGPMATARRRAATLQESAGVAVVPMVALLAEVELSAQWVSALRVLAAEPADLTSVDAFVTGAHRVPGAVRAQLLARLDRFGIAHATLALSRGADAGTLPAECRRLSLVDQVCAAVHTAAAPVRYHRMRWALAELRALAAAREDASVGRFLSADETVLASMAAAVDVVQADGMTVDPGVERHDHLRRAQRWRHYRDGPVGRLHRSCADDIVRGSLRRMAGAGGGR